MMIKYLLILIFSFSVILKADAFDPDVEITIKGLVCQLCAVGLKKSFAKHINVKGLKMDTEKGILSLEYWGIAIPSPEIKEMVKKSGYEVSSIKCK
jgi:hypothetical protein